MKQVVEFKRIERVKLELEVLEPLGRGALEEYMNIPRPIGSPAPMTISHETSAWDCVGGQIGARPDVHVQSHVKPKRRVR